jgi:hypothetical protein
MMTGDDPRLHPAPVDGGEQVVLRPMLRSTEIDCLQAVLHWIRSTVARPDPRLGRPGAVCPFVGPALESDQLTIGVYEDVDGSDVERIESLVRLHLAGMTGRPPQGRHHLLTAVVLAFPRIPADRLHVLDAVHSRINHEVVRTGHVIGQFHPSCATPAVRNPDFRVRVGPVPCIALRSMAEHDILFLHDKEPRFAEYARRFGALYRDGRVADPRLVELYQKTAARFGIGDIERA